MRGSFDARFWSHVDISDGCWWWRGCLGRNGYGQIKRTMPDGRVMRVAHRYSYEMVVGSIPRGLDLDHLCRDRSCVRPDHLEPVSRAENARRGVGPSMAALRQSSKTHCINGHVFDASNTILIVGDGRQPSRRCRACHNARLRGYRRRDREQAS